MLTVIQMSSVTMDQPQMGRPSFSQTKNMRKNMMKEKIKKLRRLRRAKLKQSMGMSYLLRALRRSYQIKLNWKPNNQFILRLLGLILPQIILLKYLMWNLRSIRMIMVTLISQSHPSSKFMHLYCQMSQKRVLLRQRKQTQAY